MSNLAFIIDRSIKAKGDVRGNAGRGARKRLPEAGVGVAIDTSNGAASLAETDLSPKLRAETVARMQVIAVAQARGAGAGAPHPDGRVASQQGKSVSASEVRTAAQDADTMCHICGDTRGSNVVFPCGHSGVCATCICRMRRPGSGAAFSRACVFCKADCEHGVAMSEQHWRVRGGEALAYEDFGIFGEIGGPELKLDLVTGLFWHVSAFADMERIADLRELRCGCPVGVQPGYGHEAHAHGKSGQQSGRGKGRGADEEEHPHPSPNPSLPPLPPCGGDRDAFVYLRGVTPREAVCGHSFHRVEDAVKHAAAAHGWIICELCGTKRASFLQELPRFSRQGFVHHSTHGDPAQGFRGHPLCRFCGIRFYDDSAMWTHLQQDHFHCHICARHEAPGTRRYFSDYADLERHFRLKHHLCEDPTCRAQRFTVFESTHELASHSSAAHGVEMSPSPSVSAMHLGFRYRSAQEEEASRRGGATARFGAHGRARQGESSPYESPAPPPSGDEEAGDEYGDAYAGRPFEEAGDVSSAVARPRHLTLSARDFPALGAAQARRTAEMRLGRGGLGLGSYPSNGSFSAGQQQQVISAEMSAEDLAAAFAGSAAFSDRVDSTDRAEDGSQGGWGGLGLGREAPAPTDSFPALIPLHGRAVQSRASAGSRAQPRDAGGEEAFPSLARIASSTGGRPTPLSLRTYGALASRVGRGGRYSAYTSLDALLEMTGHGHLVSTPAPSSLVGVVRGEHAGGHGGGGGGAPADDDNKWRSMKGGRVRRVRGDEGQEGEGWQDLLTLVDSGVGVGEEQAPLVTYINGIPVTVKKSKSKGGKGGGGGGTQVAQAVNAAAQEAVPYPPPAPVRALPPTEARASGHPTPTPTPSPFIPRKPAGGSGQFAALVGTGAGEGMQPRADTERAKGAVAPTPAPPSEVIAGLQAALTPLGPPAFSTFKALSHEYRQGGNDARSYHDAVRVLFEQADAIVGKGTGLDTFARLFPSLLATLPEESLRSAANGVHAAWIESRAREGLAGGDKAPTPVPAQGPRGSRPPSLAGLGLGLAAGGSQTANHDTQAQLWKAHTASGGGFAAAAAKPASVGVCAPTPVAPPSRSSAESWPTLPASLPPPAPPSAVSGGTTSSSLRGVLPPSLRALQSKAAQRESAVAEAEARLAVMRGGAGVTTLAGLGRVEGSIFARGGVGPDGIPIEGHRSGPMEADLAGLMMHRGGGGYGAVSRSGLAHAQGGACGDDVMRVGRAKGKAREEEEEGGGGHLPRGTAYRAPDLDAFGNDLKTGAGGPGKKKGKAKGKGGTEAGGDTVEA